MPVTSLHGHSLPTSLLRHLARLRLASLGRPHARLNRHPFSHVISSVLKLPQVEKHREKMQKAKEEAALRAVRAAVPELGPTVCVLALEGAGWEANSALQLLKGFGTDKADELAVLQQARRTLECWCLYMDLVGT